MDGSPIIVVKAGKEFATKNSSKKLGVVLVDDDLAQLRQLQECLGSTLPYPTNFEVRTWLADSHALIPKIIEQIRRRRTAPSFFLVDPYGHPLSITVMNDMLALPRSELLINFMWYRINMDMTNDAVQHHVSELFGGEEWKEQPFMSQRGAAREKGALDYFRSRLAAQYVLPFRIRFDAHEDHVGGNRTKYYLIHASNNLKAVLLMKEVMWPLGDEEGTFDFSAKSQDVLISQTPQRGAAHDPAPTFAGRQLAFDDIRGRTWPLPFIEKHYRSVLQDLRASEPLRLHR